MDNKQINRLIVIITLIIAIIGLSVSLFAISTTVKISGYANMNKAGWNIHFENLQSVQLTGNAYETLKPTIDDLSTSIHTFNVLFNSPVDTATYKFDVVNSGTIDAKITTISILNPVCFAENEETTADATLVCQNFEYELMYASGKRLKINDELPAGSRKTLKLIMRYKSDSWPISSVRVTGLSASIIYSQL